MNGIMFTLWQISSHHPEFGVILKEKLDALGVEVVLQSRDDGSDKRPMWTFLFKHLKPEFAPALPQ